MLWLLRFHVIFKHFQNLENLLLNILKEKLHISCTLRSQIDGGCGIEGMVEKISKNNSRGGGGGWNSTGGGWKELRILIGGGGGGVGF